MSNQHPQRHLSLSEITETSPDFDFGKFWKIAASLAALCAAPLVLLSLGVDFSSGQAAPTQNVPPGEFVAVAHRVLCGNFTHTLLEWTAVCAAVFVGLLCLVHYRLTREPSLPIIGVALMCAGSMDAFHTLAADRLIQSVADNRQLIPLTWALCRLFNALILLIGVGFFAFVRKKRDTAERGILFVTLTSLLFIGVTYLTVHLCVTSPSLPQTIFPDDAVKRPYDIYVLIPYLLCGFVVFPKYLSRHRTLFAGSLLLSVIPHVATQLYMAFGSSQPHDSCFNIAHAFKVLSYSFPLCGVLLELVFNDQRRIRAESALQAQTIELERLNMDLAAGQYALEAAVQRLEKANENLFHKNAELDEFTYVASHDLQEPIRKLVSFSSLLRRDAGDALPERAETDLTFITDAAYRMQTLIEDLLILSRAGRSAMKHDRISLDECVDNALEVLDVRIEETRTCIIRDELPELIGDPTMLTQLYQNLISNALKFNRSEHPEIRLTAEGEGEFWILGVQDNGIGIDQEFCEQIFSPFKRLHGRGEFEGTGIGLAICRKTAERHGGKIWVESQPGEGAHFKFTIPINLEQEPCETEAEKQPSFC